MNDTPWDDVFPEPTSLTQPDGDLEAATTDESLAFLGDPSTFIATMGKPSFRQGTLIEEMTTNAYCYGAGWGMPGGSATELAQLNGIKKELADPDICEVRLSAYQARLSDLEAKLVGESRRELRGAMERTCELLRAAIAVYGAARAGHRIRPEVEWSRAWSLRIERMQALRMRALVLSLAARRPWAPVVSARPHGRTPRRVRATARGSPCPSGSPGSSDEPPLHFGRRSVAHPRAEGFEPHRESTAGPPPFGGLPSTQARCPRQATRACYERWSERPWKSLHFLVLEEAGVYAGEGGVVHVPYRRRDGSVFREHLFAESGATWWSPGQELLPLGLETLPDPNSDHGGLALIIAEGESDTFAIREAFASVAAGASIRGYYVIGLPGAGTWRRHWLDYVRHFDIVYVVGDGDIAGRRMLNKVWADVPWARPVRLPAGSDARSLLQGEGPRALDRHLDLADSAARLMAAFRVSPGLDACQRLLRGEEVLRDEA